MPQPLAPDLRRRAMQCTEEEAELHARETTSPVEDAQGIFNACGRRRLAGRQTKHKTGRGLLRHASTQNSPAGFPESLAGNLLSGAGSGAPTEGAKWEMGDRK